MVFTDSFCREGYKLVHSIPPKTMVLWNMTQAFWILLSPAGWDHCSRCSVRDLHEFLEEFDAYASASNGFEWRKLALFLVFSRKCDCLVWDAMSPCLPRLALLPFVSGSVSHLLSQLVWDAVSALWGLLTEPSTGSAMSYCTHSLLLEFCLCDKGEIKRASQILCLIFLQPFGV